MRPAAILAAALCTLAAAPAGARDWFVEARYTDPAAIARVAMDFQHLDVDAKHRLLRVDTDEDGIRRLADAGFDVRIDTVASAQLQAFYDSASGGLAQSIPGYACYRTVEETYASMDQLAATHPDLAAVDVLGPSWQKTQNAAQGYSLRALRLTNFATLAGDPQRPRMVVFGSIHAREYTPAELLTRWAEALVSGYGTDPRATWLLDHTDFRLVLQANPDGRKKAEAGAYWRKNTNTVDAACTGSVTSSHQPGVDLNRNFPFHWNVTAGQGSSGTKCNETYRGPSAGSEAETQALVAYVAGTPDGSGVYQGGVFPDRRADAANVAAPEDYAGLFFDIHSYSQLVLWPWGDTTAAAPNRDALQTLGRRIAWFNGYTPEQSDSLYPTDGATDDNFYGSLGVPAFTIELGQAFFESCTTFQNSTLPQNVAALTYAARSAWRPYLLPAGPDARDLALDHASVGAGQSVHLTAMIDDTHYNQDNGTQATYAIRGANAYIDRVPWDPAATPIALQAADGNLNAATEAVAGDLSTAGLAPGRHLIFVQGTNAKGPDGSAGPPDAIFLDILDDDRIFADDFEGAAR